ncbi:MAG: type II toxin-antitoxin system RatA family toxin [Alphaproteobacteria bacterium]
MPRHKEQRLLPYTPEQMFDLVADVERYPQFLPWVTGARITKRVDNVIYADLLVGFKMIRERYTSRVVLDKPGRIDVNYENGPFKHLENHWQFLPRDGGCMIDFYLDFEFRSRMLQMVIGSIFFEAVRKMVAAFENRAKQLYGQAPSDPSRQPAS